MKKFGPDFQILAGTIKERPASSALLQPRPRYLVEMVQVSLQAVMFDSRADAQ